MMRSHAITCSIFAAGSCKLRPSPVKNRICLAWFGDLDTTDRGIKLSRSITSNESASRATRSDKARPRLKDVAELRQMFRHR